MHQTHTKATADVSLPSLMRFCCLLCNSVLGLDLLFLYAAHVCWRFPTISSFSACVLIFCAHRAFCPLCWFSDQLSCLMLFVKATIPTERPSTGPGISRICVNCSRGTETPTSSQKYWRWSTGRCRWGASGTVATGVLLGRSKCLALPPCSPRNFTSDQNSNSLRPQS